MNPESQKGYEKSQETKAPKNCGLTEEFHDLGKGGREAILDDIQANWGRLPPPPSAEEVNRWINASRRGE